MKKAESKAHFGRRNARTDEHEIFNLFENSPKYRKLKIFPKLSAFFRFLSGAFCFLPHLRQAKTQNLRTCFSVIQLSNIKKTKRAATFKSLSENFRVTAPKTIFEFLELAEFLCFGSGNTAPAFLNPGLQTVKAAERRLIFRIIKTCTQTG